MKNKSNLLAIIIAASLPICAQATGNTVTTVSGANTITTCKHKPAGLDSFMMEHAVDVTTIKSTLIPGLPDDVSNAVFSGAKEVRSRISYDKTTKVLDNQLFLVDPGSVLPTASNIDFPKVRFAWISVNVNKIYLSCNPTASVMLTGTTVSGFPIYAPPAGAPYAFSFSYTMDAQPVFKDIVSLSAGLALLYHDTAPGTIKWTKKVNN
ncbi:MAG: hypothetical protein K9L60_10520 [Methylovulum sp.]|nr:hypothetical protein [Methylovulum sp.]MCF7999553.1 hypothetical protein [Methylovulum sp.]